MESACVLREGLMSFMYNISCSLRFAPNCLRDTFIHFYYYCYFSFCVSYTGCLQNEDLRPKTQKRRPKNEDPKTKTQKRRLVFFTGLSNQSQSSRVNAFPQTPTYAKPLGSSFCRLSQVKLQNEDPRLNALFVVN